MTNTYIFRPPNERKARQWTAALRAASIPCGWRRGKQGQGSVIEVSQQVVDRATEELAAYETANCGWPPEAEPPASPKESSEIPLKAWQTSEISTVIAAGLLLPLWHFLLYYQGRDDSFRQLGAASHLIFEQGEWYRALTALTLHVDGGHLLSNTVWGILLGCGLALQIGGGGALLLGLLSGAGGNLLAAAVVPAPRSAVGASTAVLGLIGILAGLSFLQKIRASSGSQPYPGYRRRAWQAVVAGLAGLAILGSAEHTDLLGHLAGFLCGLLLAPAAYRTSQNGTGQRCQMLMLAVYITLLAAAWLTALRSGI